MLWVKHGTNDDIQLWNVADLQDSYVLMLADVYFCCILLGSMAFISNWSVFDCGATWGDLCCLIQWNEWLHNLGKARVWVNDIECYMSYANYCDLDFVLLFALILVDKQMCDGSWMDVWMTIINKWKYTLDTSI